MWCDTCLCNLGSDTQMKPRLSFMVHATSKSARCNEMKLLVCLANAFFKFFVYHWPLCALTTSTKLLSKIGHYLAYFDVFSTVHHSTELFH